MTLKKKLGMGIASAVLGAALVGGGTFAFSVIKKCQTIHLRLVRLI